ncbi:PREDICTED: melanoma-associated antigen 10-like [Condylura cristata]|uniref:melanoma-associated antigen 10-like n=1 Tax=Condylura cristata TaxID=143302 RepID=UPI0003343C42|nr:PREDICTED: melanoma-associated antigen 10-like [Condylura cristata]XP_012582561.1 PREDICTED: melanoma-associated antigen 10-like [Condylura cristata]XP_012582562.1 PREDICTED: melanoma-associated antigen 10-like [Condylura cristata]
MPANHKYVLCNLDEDRQEPREDEPFLHMLWGEEEGMVTSSSSSSASASASSSSHQSPVSEGVPEEAAGDADAPHSPPSAPSSPPALAAPSASVQHEEGAAEARAGAHEAVHEKMAEMVEFLLFKYRVKELVTEAEMVHVVLGGEQGHFPVAFCQACECLQLVFGLEVQETEPDGDTYIVITALGLTYDGLTSPEETLPKTGLLVMVLAVVLLGGDRASEAHMWEALGVMGVFAGVQHFIFGEPRLLLTEAWVEEQYLEYRQVPHSDPPRYEFLWGPRAHAETSRMEVLGHLLRINRKQPNAFLAFSE